MLELSALGIGWVSLMMLALMITLLLTGMQLAFVTGLVAVIFAIGWFGVDAIGVVASRVYSFVGSYVFLAVPMFVMMAALLDRSGIAVDLFEAMKKSWSKTAWRRCSSNTTCSCCFSFNVWRYWW